MTAPTKPAAKPRATWTVLELVEHVDVSAAKGVKDEGAPLLDDVTVLVVHAVGIVARTGAEACWHIAETALRDVAQGTDPPILCASRNGTAHGLTEARPYALKPTVERVK